MSSSANHNRLHAFTLLELLVGMIVSSIAISAAFTAIGIVQRQYLRYEAASESGRQLSFFISTISTDFNMASVVHFKNDREIEFSSGAINLDYLFRDQYVLRTGTETDTFHVAVSALNAFYLNAELTEENAAADEVQLHLHLGAKDEMLILRKPHDAKNLLEADGDYKDILEHGKWRSN